MTDDEKIQKFMNDRSIKAVVFDLDDTLIGTHAVFQQKYDSVVKGISKELSISEEEVRKVWQDTLGKVYNKVAVNPQKLWPGVLKGISVVYDIGKDSQERYVSEMYEVYKTVPELLEGCHEMLASLQSAGVDMGIVTHAKKDWVDFKVDNLDLRKYFLWIELVSADEFKEARDWKLAIEKNGLRPVDVMVVGDNIKGDMLSADEIGVRHKIWMNGKTGWDIYRDGNVPDDVIEVHSPRELLELMLE